MFKLLSALIKLAFVPEFNKLPSLILILTSDVEVKKSLPEVCPITTLEFVLSMLIPLPLTEPLTRMPPFPVLFKFTSLSLFVTFAVSAIIIPLEPVLVKVASAEEFVIVPLTRSPFEPLLSRVNSPMLVIVPFTVKASAELSNNNFPLLSTTPLIVNPFEPSFVNTELPLLV